jgi:hypothetical protein
MQRRAKACTLGRLSAFVPPRHTDPRLGVLKLPPVTMAVLTYGWFISKERNEEMAAELLAASRSGRSATTRL